MPIAGLTSDQIRSSLVKLDARIPSREHQKGRPYRRQVPGELELDGTRLVVEIQGSAFEPYEVVLDFQPTRIEPSCTCPFAEGHGLCKHIAAVTDAVIARLLGGSRPAQADPMVESVRRVEEAIARLATSQRPPVEAKQALTWEIEIDTRRVAITPYLHRRLKSGALRQGRRVGVYDLVRRTDIAMDPRDERLVGLLGRHYGYSFDGAFPGHYILEMLEGHPAIHIAGRGGPVTLKRAGVGLAALDGGDGTYRLQPALDGRPLVPGRGSGAVGMECLAAFDATELVLRYASCSAALATLLGAISALPGSVPRDMALALVDKVAAAAPSLSLALPAELEGEAVAADTRVILRLTPTGSGGAAVDVRFRPVPGGPAVEPGKPPVRLAATASGKRLVAARDLASETAQARNVSSALALSPDEKAGWTDLLESDDDVLDLLGRLEGLDPANVAVEWPEGEHARRVVTPPSTAFKVGVEARQDWFGLEGGLEVEGELIALGVLLSAAREGRRWVEVGKGRFVELARVFGGKLDELALLARENRGAVELPRGAAPLATDLLSEIELTRAPASWHALVQRVRELPAFEPHAPSELRAELRPYQLEGYRWLRRLAELGIGGCLADDMGLGKTVQAIAALLERSKEGPALVVAPTSVGFNWMRELERFAPALRARNLRTEDRAKLLAGAGPGDVVVASYGLLRLEAEALSSVEWGTLVLDEAQAVKNAATDTARSARGLRAKWTMALTGTPVENHLGELWSLFHTIAPGLLGSWEQFAQRFAGPIEREKNAGRRKALARIVRPFILRRVKSEVLKELPPRTEVRLDVVLSKAERALYEKARLGAIARLASPSPDRDQRFEVLAELTKLRQLACHARLVEPKAPRVSAKLALLLEQLDEILAGEHRALVFSQFTRHLDLVGEALAERGIETLRLDGKTPPRERERLVDAFQKGEAPVFLISLKAGGSGLNLTAADYVFHLDPWWNPAVEDQAADRAHRIGQQRAVTVVRLVTRDTIEEKVLALHEDKRDLVAGILDGSDRAGKLSTQELVALLREGARESAGVEVAEDAAPEERGKRVPGDLLEKFEDWVVSDGRAGGTARMYAREAGIHLALAVAQKTGRRLEDRLLERLVALEGELAHLSVNGRKTKAVAFSRFVGFLTEKGLVSDEGFERAQELLAKLRR